MTNHRVGHDAEKQAAEYLKNLGFSVKELNWKTKLCEIDIVAERDRVIWFVEVKSRSNSRQGNGYEYVTQGKLQQMQFAAEMWVQGHEWNGDYQLAVISMDGGDITLFDEL